MKRLYRGVYRTLRSALHAMRRNVMRSILTTLGIIIGVGAVIAMMEIGGGSSSLVQATIASMGANTVLVMPGQATSGGISFGSGTTMTLTPDDCEAILRECPSVRNAAPIVNARAQVVYGAHNWVPQSITGTDAGFLDIRDWSTLDQGEPISDRDVRNASKVCLIGQTLLRELFQGESPIGKELRIQNVSFRVIGVLGRKGANMMGRDQDDIVIAPWTTIKYRVSGKSTAIAAASTASSDTSNQVNSLSDLYPTDQVQLYPVPSAIQQADTPLPVRFANVDQVLVSATSAEEVKPAIEQITSLLHQRHRIHDGEPDDFTIRDMTELIKALTSTTGLMTTLLLVVAMISLVVGGVGIMNIMLVSVTERTREIGLRMAVGARSRDILWQFLTEAILLCLAGGAIGVLGGRGCSYLITAYLRWPTQVSIVAIVGSVLVSAGVGIIFGFYPAWKASRLDPIEALRYE
jgi:ABC-type antimicrobial peptide transport system permease subunit